MFKEFVPVENENFVILKIEQLLWIDITPKTKIILDSKKQRIINKLKNDTEFNNNLFVVSDFSSLIVSLNLNEIDKYISFFKYCKLIEIQIEDSKSQYNEEIIKIRKLPNLCNYKFKVNNPKQFVTSDAFNLIVNNFESIEDINAYPYTIKINKPETEQEDNNSRVKFILTNNNNHEETTVNYEELKEIISKSESF